MISHSKPLRPRTPVWLIVPVAFAILFAVLLIQSDWDFSRDVILTAMGGIVSTAFFFHRSHAEDARFMKELFEYFNARYDQQNNDLLLILQKPGELTPENKIAFIDYFNLCAEEWVFRRAGYIYDPVWRAWENGMRQYARDARVAALWDLEKKTDSYYGFQFPIAGVHNP